MQIIHEPIRPVRQEVLGELVFVEQWQKLMSTKPERLDEDDDRTWLEVILRDMGVEVAQRHATVAASVVCWFGTNCGASFLLAGKKAAALNSRRAPMVWTGAWAQENHRILGVSGGYRTLEHILADDSDRTAQGLVGLWRTPDLSVDDFEVAEHLCAWLGSFEGEQFLSRCEQRIEQLLKAANGNAGRIIPCEGIPDAVWVTPFFCRDSEELMLAGKVLGGWKKHSDNELMVFANDLDRAAKQGVKADPGSARAWVEAHASEFVNTLQLS